MFENSLVWVASYELRVRGWGKGPFYHQLSFVTRNAQPVTRNSVYVGENFTDYTVVESNKFNEHNEPD